MKLAPLLAAKLTLFPPDAPVYPVEALVELITGAPAVVLYVFAETLKRLFVS